MVAPDVTVAELLNDEDGCHGLHQRVIVFGPGGVVTGVAGGIGEAWYVAAGTGLVSPGPYALAAGSAIWLPAVLATR